MPVSVFFAVLGSYRNVGVAAKAAFFHVAVADAEILENLPERPQISDGFRRGAQIGLADDFQEWHAGAIQVDQAGGTVGVVNIFAGVFLHMNPRQANAFFHAIHFDVDMTAGANRQFVLTDLITLRQIRIEIVFAGEDARGRDLAVRRQARLDGKFDDPLIENRQNTGESGTNRTGILIGLVAELG